MSGSFPQLSDNSRKTLRKQIVLEGTAAKQKGGAVGGSVRKHAGSMDGNRQRAHRRARGNR